MAVIENALMVSEPPSVSVTSLALIKYTTERT